MNNNADLDELVEAIGQRVQQSNANENKYIKAADTIGKWAERFSQKQPGRQASLVGIVMAISSVLLEVLNALPLFSFKFDFVDQMSITLLIVGSILILAGGLFNTYFALRASAALEEKLNQLQNEKKDLSKQIQEASKDNQNILKKLSGIFN
jgi:hypothetical protein